MALMLVANALSEDTRSDDPEQAREQPAPEGSCPDEQSGR